MFQLCIQIALTYRLPLREVAKMAGIKEDELYNSVVRDHSYRYALHYLAYETANLTDEQLQTRKKQANLMLLQFVYAKRNNDKNMKNALIHQLLIIDRKFQMVKKKYYQKIEFSKEDFIDIISYCLKYGISYDAVAKEFGFSCKLLFGYEKYIENSDMQERFSFFHEFGCEAALWYFGKSERKKHGLL